MSLPRRFADHAVRSRLLRGGDRVLVACSGGADSTALLRLLLATRRLTGIAEVCVAHLDHGLRRGSADDARFVADLAEGLRLRSVVERRRVRRRRGESPEEAARRVRYAFLSDAAAALGCDVVATAHHLDDQAETVLYRVLRGAGLEGLRGILPESRAGPGGVRVVRPLLPFRREAIRSWLRREGGVWVEDPTNLEGNDRARLRAEVLPLVRRLLRRDPAAPLARLADAARAEFERRAAAPHRAAATQPVRAAPPRLRLTWRRAPLSVALLLQRLRARPGEMELLDAAAVRGRLLSRAPRPGDRFQARGLPRPQRLGHYLQRRSVPAEARAAVPLLCDDEGILCVGGRGIAARAAVTPRTERVVVVRVSADRTAD